MKLKRAALIVLSLISLVSSLVPLLGGMARVSAAGESYSWSDTYKINASGGELSGTTTLVGGPAVPGYDEVYTGTATHSSGCLFILRVTLRSSQTGEVAGVKYTGAGSGGPNTPACSEDVYNRYNSGPLVNITGTRPEIDPDAETQSERAAYFTIKLAYTDESQKDDKYYVSVSGDGPTTSANLIYLGVGPSQNDRTEITFGGTVYLDPGNYTCDINKLPCTPFEKVKHTPYRYTTGDGIVVTLNATFSNKTGTLTLPATKLSLQKPDGTELQTVTTEAKSIEAPKTQNDRENLITVQAAFAQVPVGSYKVCAGTTCENVTRTNGQVARVTLTIDGTVANGGGTGEEKSCESQPNVVMAWVTCPIINAIDGATDFLDNQIISLLLIPKDYYAKEDPETCSDADTEPCQDSALYQTWQRLRNVAILILVPILLFMVISTALGFDFVDAYTIKKALPRFVIAVIFISLSWFIVTFLIDITNDIGQGILGIMTAPFGGANGISLRSLYDPTALEGVAGGGAVVVGGGAATAIFLYMLISGGAIGVIFSFGFTTLIALLLAFLVLATRQMLVIALMIFAPIAILSWIFPGNDKLWKLWWQSFSKLLIMFPMIMVLIGAGRIFASIINTAGSDTLFNTILKLIAYIAPYFFIPATFKLAGSLFATITGVVNNRSKGLFDRGKKYRAGKTGEAKKTVSERNKGGKAIQGAKPGSLAHKFNMKAQKLGHLSNAADTGFTKVFKEGKANIAAAVQASEKKEQKHIMEDEIFNTWAPFDDVSGMAGDVLLGNAYGIKRRLLKQGVGAQKDANGEIMRDEEGNILIADQAKLDAAANRVIGLMNQGKTPEALRQGLLEAGTFKKKRADGTEYTDEAELDKNVSHFARAKRHYGNEALSQALVKKAGAGGTYYDTAADAWMAANLATEHDGAARADFGATFRGILVNAGRADQGGGAFGKTLKFMDGLKKAQELADINGTTIEEEIKKLERGHEGIDNNTGETIHVEGYTEHILGNNPASIMFHHTMKENYIENNIIPVMQDRIKRTAAAAAGKGEDSPEFAAYMKAIADADNVYQQALATKPALAQKLGDKIMNLEITDGVEHTVEVDTGLLDASGKKITRVEVIPPTVTNVRAAGAKYKGNAVWQRYHKEWISAEDAAKQLEYQQQQDAARQAAFQQQQDQGPPPAPGAGPGGTMGPTMGPPLS